MPILHISHCLILWLNASEKTTLLTTYDLQAQCINRNHNDVTNLMHHRYDDIYGRTNTIHLAKFHNAFAHNRHRLKIKMYKIKTQPYTPAQSFSTSHHVNILRISLRPLRGGKFARKNNTLISIYNLQSQCPLNIKSTTEIERVTSLPLLIPPHKPPLILYFYRTLLRTFRFTGTSHHYS